MSSLSILDVSKVSERLPREGGPTPDEVCLPAPVTILWCMNLFWHPQHDTVIARRDASMIQFVLVNWGTALLQVLPYWTSSSLHHLASFVCAQHDKPGHDVEVRLATPTHQIDRHHQCASCCGLAASVSSWYPFALQPFLNHPTMPACSLVFTLVRIPSADPQASCLYDVQ